VRVLERLERIYELSGGIGANRPAYSPAEDAAHGLVTGWMRDAGLSVERDAAGNLFGRLGGHRPDLPEVWTGSHLDSVPRGGRFDGPLGVVAGLEAVARLGRQERTLCVVAFRDEEGWRFGLGCFGSRALCGDVEARELRARDAEGVTLAEAVGAELPTGGWLVPPAAYVEAHIEQGPVLDGLDAPLGVVTSIVGLARLAVTFSGRAGHAGTTPMAGRDDALVKASRFVLDVRKAASPSNSLLQGDDAVATVGAMKVEPGAANVIPSRVELKVDARAPDDATLSAVLAAIRDAAGGASVKLLGKTSPAPMADTVREALRESLQELGQPVHELRSGAGHDARVLAAAGVPSGMLFVRSRNGGVSHSPDEWSEPEDVALCVDILAGALRRLATTP
jgi:allantoate deiminase